MKKVCTTGRIVKTMHLQANGGSSIATSLDVGHLQRGVYFIKLQGSNSTITKQFLKN